MSAVKKYKSEGISGGGAPLTILGKIAKLKRQGKKGALATVVEARGSTPRKAGAKMLVSEDGTFSGSICGGCVEAEVYQEACSVLKDGEPKMLEFKLNEKEGGGMICGGVLKVFIEPV